jgi:carbon storage regulator CsrA
MFVLLRKKSFMLVLSRRPHEKICIPAIDATIYVTAVKPGVVRVAIDAPNDVAILRGELTQPPSRAGKKPSAPEKPARTLLRAVADRLRQFGIGLGAIRLQLNAGMIRDAAATLMCVQGELQLLRYGIDGEAEEDPSPAGVPARRPKEALLVEDDQNERELLAGFLRRSGLEVHTAGDGADALDYLRAGAHPDIVLLDMGLPRCDGATAVREIRSNPAHQDLKIFAVSGHLPEEFDLPEGRQGIDRWFQKPLDPNVLLQSLAIEIGAQ